LRRALSNKTDISDNKLVFLKHDDLIPLKHGNSGFMPFFYQNNFNFLILHPQTIEAFKIIDSEYLECDEYFFPKVVISQGTREIMPVSMISILEKVKCCFLEFSGDEYQSEKLEIYNSLNNRYRYLFSYYEPDANTILSIENLFLEIELLISTCQFCPTLRGGAVGSKLPVIFLFTGGNDDEVQHGRKSEVS
jgi:hypothetical protein